MDLFELIGRLSVRDEFCQKVLELGGVAHILSALQNNISNKVLICKLLFHCCLLVGLLTKGVQFTASWICFTAGS